MYKKQYSILKKPSKRLVKNSKMLEIRKAVFKDCTDSISITFLGKMCQTFPRQRVSK